MGRRSTAVLAAAAVVVLLLSACGGSESDGGSITTNEVNQYGEPVDGSHGENDAGESAKEPGPGESPPRFSVEEVEGPLKVSGGGSEQFLIKGGDNSIQEYGEESGESELQEAAEQVHDFFVARAMGDWEKACSYLSKSMSEQLNSSPKARRNSKTRAVPRSWNPSPAASRPLHGGKTRWSTPAACGWKRTGLPHLLRAARQNRLRDAAGTGRRDVQGRRPRRRPAGLSRLSRARRSARGRGRLRPGGSARRRNRRCSRGMPGPAAAGRPRCGTR